MLDGSRRSLIAGIALLSALFVPGSSLAATTTPRTIVLVNANQSNNWGGYNQGFVDHNIFTQVSGDWTVQTPTNHTSGRAEHSATWVGVGGGCITDDCLWTDNTLIQAGTTSDVSAAGLKSYTAWWEIIPAPSIAISMAVRAGDRMHVDITQTLPGEVWTITVTNVTTAATFTRLIPYPSTYASAEWIVETPLVFGTGGAGISAMPSLTKTSFTNAKVNGASPSFAATQEMQLVDLNNNVIATPSAPLSGNSFNVCTYASSCS